MRNYVPSVNNYNNNSKNNKITDNKLGSDQRHRNDDFYAGSLHEEQQIWWDDAMVFGPG